jgi:hypothetical protein
MIASPAAFRIAAIAGSFFTDSHADVILSRWYVDRESDRRWGWSGPRTRLVSMYVEQPEYTRPTTPDRQRRPLTRDVSQHAGIASFDSVEDALTCGGDALAVDGVMLIAEHGDYPENHLGQVLYPRKELFDQVVSVFRSTGQTVPVFCDKFFSWNFDWAREMVHTAREMGFLLFSGSSIPLCPLKPALRCPPGTRVLEALGTFGGHRESYGYHTMELVQSLIEQRTGGEPGVNSVTAFVGEDAWRILSERPRSGRLLEVAIGAMMGNGGGRLDQLKSELEFPGLLVFEHRDGLRVNYFYTGALEHFTAAIATADHPNPRAGVAITGGRDDGFGHFAALAKQVEDTFLTGEPAFPPQRSLLTNGMLTGALHAIHRAGHPIVFPDGICSYQRKERCTCT